MAWDMGLYGLGSFFCYEWGDSNLEKERGLNKILYDKGKGNTGFLIPRPGGHHSIC